MEIGAFRVGRGGIVKSVLKWNGRLVLLGLALLSPVACGGSQRQAQGAQFDLVGKKVVTDVKCPGGTTWNGSACLGNAPAPAAVAPVPSPQPGPDSMALKQQLEQKVYSGFAGDTELNLLISTCKELGDNLCVSQARQIKQRQNQ
jgi:hypothetical protein